MATSHVSLVATEFPQKKDVTVEYVDQGPMSQQDAADSHGHEMHPQKFVRLIGCHQSNAATHRLH